MLVASVSLVAFADAPKAADFTANNGFYIMDENGERTDVKDPADLADTATGLQVIHGGYYQSGDNCGGLVSNEKYDLNGFEATVYFEKAPEVTTDTDCWVSMDFLAAPRPFFTGNFNLEGENPGNQGIMDLIRFGKPYLEIYDGLTGFSGVYNTQSVDATINEMFSITSGTTLTIKLARNEDYTYTMTFAREGFEDFTVPYNFPVGDLFADGKAHFSLIASCKIAGEDAWTYYITDIKNGVEMTAEEIAAREAQIAEAARQAQIEASTKEIEAAEEKANEAVEKAAATGDEAAIAKAQEAKDAITAAYAALEAENWEEVTAQSDLARDYAKEANDLSRAAEKNAPADDDNNTDDPANDENKTDAPAASNGGMSPIVWVIIILAIIVVIVVIFVVAKKKK